VTRDAGEEFQDGPRRAVTRREREIFDLLQIKHDLFRLPSNNCCESSPRVAKLFLNNRDVLIVKILRHFILIMLLYHLQILNFPVSTNIGA